MTRDGWKGGVKNFLTGLFLPYSTLCLCTADANEDCARDLHDDAKHNTSAGTGTSVPLSGMNAAWTRLSLTMNGLLTCATITFRFRQHTSSYSCRSHLNSVDLHFLLIVFEAT